MLPTYNRARWLCAVCCVLCAVCCVLCAVCRVPCAVCCVLCAVPHVPHVLAPLCRMLTERFQWSFDDEDDEDDEFQPVVVDLGNY